MPDVHKIRTLIFPLVFDRHHDADNDHHHYIVEAVLRIIRLTHTTKILPSFDYHSIRRTFALYSLLLESA